MGFITAITRATEEVNFGNFDQTFFFKNQKVKKILTDFKEMEIY